VRHHGRAENADARTDSDCLVWAPFLEDREWCGTCEHELRHHAHGYGQQHRRHAQPLPNFRCAPGCPHPSRSGGTRGENATERQRRADVMHHRSLLTLVVVLPLPGPAPRSAPVNGSLSGADIVRFARLTNASFSSAVSCMDAPPP
jgi:hypothetical protein